MGFIKRGQLNRMWQHCQAGFVQCHLMEVGLAETKTIFKPSAFLFYIASGSNKLTVLVAGVAELADAPDSKSGIRE
ncbi:MAG: hypothetical protein WCJ07_15540, partial [Verrucomicrobiota bacterium]